MPDAEASDRKTGFPPVVDKQTRLLVLGSLPGDASLKAGQYYGHPRNGFWRLIGGVIGCDLAALPYPARLEALKEVGIGLWDVIAEAERKGSLDAAIRDAAPADLHRLIDSLPKLKVIAFNGATAATRGRRQLAGVSSVTLIDLPSSSPAHARPFAEKAARWDALRVWIAPS